MVQASIELLREHLPLAYEREKQRERREAEKLYPKPELNDILELESDLEQLWHEWRHGEHSGENDDAPRKGRPGLIRIREMRNLRDEMPSKWAELLKSPARYRTAMTAIELQRTVALATRNPPRITVPPSSGDHNAQKAATKESRWCNALLPALERQANLPLLRMGADSLFEGGLGAFEIYTRDTYDDLDLKKVVNETVEAYRARTDEALLNATLRRGMPIGMRHIDPLALLFDMDDMGVCDAMIVEWKSSRRVWNALRRRYSHETLEKKGLPRPGDHGWPSASPYPTGTMRRPNWLEEASTPRLALIYGRPVRSPAIRSRWRGRIALTSASRTQLGRTEEMRRERGEGTWLAPTRDGRVRLQISAGRKRDGSRDRKVFTARTKREARALAAKYLEAKEAETEAEVVLGADTLLADYLDQWLQRRRPRLRQTTYDSYRELILLHILPEIGNVAIGDLRRPHVERVMAAVRGKGLSPRRANMARSVLHAALGDAEDDELVIRNAAARTRPLRHRGKQGDPLSPEEVRRLLAHVEGTRWHPLYVVTVSMGLRQGEALGLCWEDVKEGYIEVRRKLRWTGRTFVLEEPKTEESVAVLPVPVHVAVALAEQRELQALDREKAGDAWQDHWPNLVFRNRHGRPYHGTSVTHRFQQDLNAVGVRRRRFHDLRHSTSTLLHSLGVSDRVIQAIMRHSSVTTTLAVYTRPDPVILQRALGDLGGLFSASQANGNPNGNANRDGEAA